MSRTSVIVSTITELHFGFLWCLLHGLSQSRYGVVQGTAVLEKVNERINRKFPSHMICTIRPVQFVQPVLAGETVVMTMQHLKVKRYLKEVAVILTKKNGSEVMRTSFIMLSEGIFSR